LIGEGTTGNPGTSPAGEDAAPVIHNKRDLALVFALACALWGLNAVWLQRDTRPPVWDMALHQTYALNYLPGAPVPPGTGLWERSGNYPPFVHIVIALAYGLFHPGPHIAILANIPATILLFWGVYELALMFAGAGAARWACALTALTPYLIWMSKETILDYWLGAWVVVSLVLLLKTEGFQSRRASVLLGLTCALGLLTKWLFAGFIAVPAAYVIIRDRIWKSDRRLINCADAVLIAAAVAGVWYLPNLPRLIRYYSENAQIGAREGEPQIISFQSLIYYLRLLEGYQLFALLFCLFLLSVFFVCRRRGMRDGKLWAAAIIGGWLAMMILRTKDPRFTLPLLGPMMIVVGAWLQSWGGGWKPRLIKIALMILLCVQAYAIDFGIPWLPQEVILAQGYQGSLRWDWNLYLQHYFHILGAPKMEDWKQDAILRRAADDARRSHMQPALAVVPDLPRFNSTNFQLFARLRGYSFRVDHPQAARNGIRAFDGYTYAIMTERDQGMSWSTAESRMLNQIIVDEHQTFQLLEVYVLPNSDAARLYAIRREGS
jgi:4-amino-4-deoxy-L-arabinose transferase-like glycosyltransferase